MAERQGQIMLMVRGAISQIGKFEEMRRAGALSDSEARDRALTVIDNLRFGHDEYVWINDMRPVVLSHPNRALVGRNVSDIMTADGRPLFGEFLRISANGGGGFLTYQWPKPGEDRPQVKLSFVERFDPWGWAVGAGVYVDDIDRAYWEAAARFGVVAGLAALVAGLAAWLTAVSITRPLARLTKRMALLAAGHEVEVPNTESRDEIGELTRAMRAFKAHLSEKDRFRAARDAVLREAGTVFNNINDAVMVTDRQNHIKLVNPAFTRVTGFGPDEVIGRTPRILASGRHDETFYRSLWDQLLSSGHWSGEIWNRGKNGEIFPEWLSITSVKGEDGGVEGYVATFNNISERKRRESRIRWQAEHDALTGLVNRSHFLASMTAAMGSAAENGEELALLFIDLDGFKAVNDKFGHSAGDTVLTMVAKRLQEQVRAGDLVARLGGDEFVVVIPSLSREADAVHIGEKIVAALAEPITVEGGVARIGGSVGVAICPVHGTDPAELIAAADAAMYQQKQAGRNGVRVADRAMQSA